MCGLPLTIVMFKRFVRAKTAQSKMISAISSAKSEIDSNRPVMLNIASSNQYNDHAVTAFRYEIYTAQGSSLTRTFFGVRDGYSSSSRYVCADEIVGLFITRVY